MGFWNGREIEEACSELTRVPATVWISQKEACQSLLMKDFTAFCIGCSLVSGCLVIWKIVDVLAWRAILTPLKKSFEIKKNE
jgi:hypothetical protein